MTAPAALPEGHYAVDPNGDRVWIGPTRAEVHMLRRQLGVAREALSAIGTHPAASTGVKAIANDGLRRSS